MKALSGYAEWFWLMGKNWKNVENRKWSIFRYFKALPVRVYLHASKTPTPQCELDIIEEMLTHEQYLQFQSIDFNELRGHIIGEIIIVDQVEGNNLAFPELEWYWGPFGFLVQDGTLYKVPVPCRGKPGFFEPEIDFLKGLHDQPLHTDQT